MKINLKNDNTGDIKQVKIGPSWTALFFGFFVPLFRADWKFFIIFFIFFVIGAMTFGLVGIIIDIIGCVKYNDWYISELLSQNYRPTNDAAAEALKQRGLYFKS